MCNTRLKKTYNNKQSPQKSKEKDVEDNARRPLPLFHKEKKVPLRTNRYYQKKFAWKSHNGIEQLKC